MTRYERFPKGFRKCRRAACTVEKEFRSGVGYCTMSCASKDGMMRVSPANARERAKKAGKAAGEAHRRRALERREQYPTKSAAYDAGYSSGYDKGHSAGYFKGLRDTRRRSNAA